MHIKTWVAALCTAALTGCFGSSGKDKANSVTGTTTTQAAEALTRAIAFEGGKLVDGLLPAGTSSDASLLPASSDALEPGASSLMSFDVTPADASVTSALIQFGDASGHFDVKSTAFGGAADGGSADGGAGEALHVELGYTTEDTVCDTLCDKSYKIPVTQALRLRGGKVTKHASTSITLDCSRSGDHKRCGKAAEAKPGDTTSGGKDAGATDAPTDAGTAGRLTPMDVAAGACNSGDAGVMGCTGFDAYQACIMAACDSTYKMCLGANYKTGDYSGSPCEAYATCSSTAPDPCASDCAMDTACQACFNNLSACATTCVNKLDCSGATGGAGDAGTLPVGGGKTCADLEACCASLTDAATKTQCNTTLTQVKAGGDMVCDAVVASFCP